MRFLHVDTGAEMRGGQHQVLLLLRVLREAGHESVLLAKERGPLWNFASETGFPVFPAEAKQLWQYSKQADIVHAHDARGHTLAALASRRKFVVSRRVAFPVRRSLASIWKYQRAARFLAVSQFVANELKASGIRKEKVDVVYDAVGPVTEAQEWSADFPAVTLASDDPEKGRDLVEEAARLSQIPVVFSEDLKTHLQRASMFVYVTRSEGLGSAVLLAMSMGVPVLASAVGGLTEIFADNVSGIFVQNDPREIAASMRKLLDTSGWANRLIAAGKTRIRECFTEKHLLDATVLSYERALGG